MIRLKGNSLTYIPPNVDKAVYELVVWREVLPTDMCAMPLSTHFHWVLLIEFEDIKRSYWVWSGNWWTRTFGVFDVHTRVEACIFVVSSHPIGSKYDTRQWCNKTDRMTWYDECPCFDSNVDVQNSNCPRSQISWSHSVKNQWDCLLKGMAL